MAAAAAAIGSGVAPSYGLRSSAPVVTTSRSETGTPCSCVSRVWTSDSAELVSRPAHNAGSNMTTPTAASSVTIEAPNLDASWVRGSSQCSAPGKSRTRRGSGRAYAPRASQRSPRHCGTIPIRPGVAMPGSDGAQCTSGSQATDGNRNGVATARSGRAMVMSRWVTRTSARRSAKPTGVGVSRCPQLPTRISGRPAAAAVSTMAVSRAG